MKKVSIIIPVYNTSEYIEECINSCMKQTLKDIEILVIDDGSKDNSYEIALKCQKKDSRIKIFKQENKGVSVARNTGINNAQGEWLVFLDGDDWLEKNAIEKMYKLADECKPDVLLTDYYTESIKKTIPSSFLNLEDTEKIDLKYKMDLLINCICKTDFSNKDSSVNIGVPWAKMYNRNFIINNELLFVEGLKRMQDMIFNINVLNKANKIMYKRINTYHYRLQINSVTKKYNPDFSNTSEQILQEIKRFIDDNKLQKEFNDIYYSKATKLLLETIKLQYVPEENNLKYREKRKSIAKLLNSEPYHTSVNNKSNIGLTNKEILFKFLMKYKFLDVLYLLFFINNKHKKRKYFKK